MQHRAYKIFFCDFWETKQAYYQVVAVADDPADVNLPVRTSTLCSLMFLRYVFYGMYLWYLGFLIQQRVMEWRSNLKDTVRTENKTEI